MAQQLKGSSGNDANDGLTWANAKATLANALGLDTVVWCDGSTGESVTGASWSVNAGTQASPVQVVAGTPDTTTGLTAESADYTVTVSGGTFVIAITGWGYYKSLTLTCGTGTNNGSIALGQGSDNYQVYDLCDFFLGGSSASARINCGIASSVNASRVEWRNCAVKFAATGQSISVQNCALRIAGIFVSPGGSTPSFLFSSTSGRFAVVEMIGGTLANLANTFSFINGASAQPINLRVAGVTLPAGWSGDLIAGTVGNNSRAELFDCDDANNGYTRFIIQDQFGKITQETSTVVVGAGDDISDYSISMASTADAQWPMQPLRMHPQYKRNTDVGVAKTFTVEVTSASALTAADLVLRVRYYSSGSTPTLSEASSAPTLVGSTPAALTTSAQSWANQLTNTYKLSVTFTPQRAGYLMWDVLLFKPSVTVKVSPKGILS